jgi:K+-sensing histidine kinase KdpD
MARRMEGATDVTDLHQAGDRWSQINGEGIAWGAGAFAASLLVGIVLQPVRRTVGLENATVVYLLVIVAAADGGRGAGLLAALAAALSYDYFLTTPDNTLVTDTAAQVVTVGLLFAAGVIASLAGRARRRAAVQARQRDGALRLLNAIAQAVAAGGDADADRRDRQQP